MITHSRSDGREEKSRDAGGPRHPQAYYDPPQKQEHKATEMQEIKNYDAEKIRRPFTETRPSLCDEDLISRAFPLVEPGKPPQGKYEEGKKERKEKGGGRLFNERAGRVNVAQARWVTRCGQQSTKK
jgi:hypothetical protein